jgi:hypothetical protein
MNNHSLIDNLIVQISPEFLDNVAKSVQEYIANNGYQQEPQQGNQQGQQLSYKIDWENFQVGQNTPRKYLYQDDIGNQFYVDEKEHYRREAIRQEKERQKEVSRQMLEQVNQPIDTVSQTILPHVFEEQGYLDVDSCNWFHSGTGYYDVQLMKALDLHRGRRVTVKESYLLMKTYKEQQQMDQRRLQLAEEMVTEQRLQTTYLFDIKNELYNLGFDFSAAIQQLGIKMSGLLEKELGSIRIELASVKKEVSSSGNQISETVNGCFSEKKKQKLIEIQTRLAQTQLWEIHKKELNERAIMKGDYIEIPSFKSTKLEFDTPPPVFNESRQDITKIKEELHGIGFELGRLNDKIGPFRHF